MSIGRPIPERRPLTDGFAAQLPPLEENNLQSSPPSFKGFLTENKKSNPSVLNTGDIWKPKLGGTQNRATPAGLHLASVASLPRLKALKAS